MTETSVGSARCAFGFDNTYARELDGFYSPWQAEKATRPELVRFNRELAHDLGLDVDALDSAEGAAIFSGNVTPDGAHTLAQAYAGHQFGGFSPQLGDGRALLLGEVVDARGCRRDIQLKGSGRTPFSRGGDGKAALGPVLREYLIAEAMHALGIPTTRALAAVTTGDPVYREETLPGAVLTRVAASHVRVGTFQFFAVRGQNERVKKLADYVIGRHYPELLAEDSPYLELIRRVGDRQASLVARWMHTGFIHGVMNTDNMAISGETIDYGPCAFMDHYDPGTVFSSIDTGGRYAYGNQPQMARWNLARFAETLLPLLDRDSERAVELANHAVDEFAEVYIDHWLRGMRSKLGLATEEPGDLELAQQLLAVMEGDHVDFTQLFWRLTETTEGDLVAASELFNEPAPFESWHTKWLERLQTESDSGRAGPRAMCRANPVYIPRNHLVEEVLETAVRDSDFGPFETLFEVLQDPFEERHGLDVYALPGPADGPPYRTFCGT